MAKKKYKFTDKSQSIGGIFSTMLSIVSIGFAAAGIMMSYEQQGNGDRIIGLFVVCSIFFAGIGLFIGIKSFQEEEIFFRFSWIGTILNAVMIIAMAIVILLGL